MVRAEIARIPGIHIVSERLHEDLTLEDSSIVVEFRGRQVELFFNWEDFPDNADPRRLMRNLKRKINAHLESYPFDQSLELTSEIRG